MPLYADLNTAAPALKRAVAASAAAARPSRTSRCWGRCPDWGVRTPALASGAGAERFAAAFERFGMPVTASAPSPARRRPASSRAACS